MHAAALGRLHSQTWRCLNAYEMHFFIAAGLNDVVRAMVHKVRAVGAASLCACFNASSRWQQVQACVPARGAGGRVKAACRAGEGPARPARPQRTAGQAVVDRLLLLLAIVREHDAPAAAGLQAGSPQPLGRRGRSD